MAELRVGRGWTDAELERRLRDWADRPLGSSETWDEMTPDRGWHQYISEAVVARERRGAPLPDGPFRRARDAVTDYRFSDPDIVTGHFEPAAPLLGRRMLLEIKVLGLLHYLCGVVVGAVRSEDDERCSTFGFRYDTLEGHIERGSEWFLVWKTYETGAIRFRVHAAWRPGDFPNWWSRAGFRVLAPIYQRRWHHRAQDRLAALARHGMLLPPRPAAGRLAHEGPVVDFRIVRGDRPS